MNPIDNPNEDTEFNDILRQHGILPARETAPPSPSPPPSPKLAARIEDKTPAELSVLAEDTRDDDEERIIQAYRRQRLAAIKKQQKNSNYGDVIPIGRDDYARQVTEASKEDELGAEGQGLGTGVIVCLYKESETQSIQLLAQLRILARRYSRSKFLSIVGNKCIENYPDRLQPTLILYRSGDVAAQVVSWGKDRVREPQELEALLVVSKVVSVADRVQEDNNPKQDNDEGNLSDEEDNRASRMAATRPRPNIRKTTVEDDDSDFDL
ncbi:hypothetical protein FRB94_004351 [Tulasnella sp. JGI-2019a]|nr:hypothetical protein FRB94_004351 [Tulasnella sp. JGI-2019a]